MPKYEVEYAQFTKVVIEAESLQAAEEQAAIMDCEDIAERDPHDYDIWNIRQVD